MIKRLGHVAIRARDIEKTAAFYRDVLGLKEAFRMQDPTGTKLGSVHLFFAPGQFLEIFPDGIEEKSSAKTTIGLHHFCIEVDDAAKALEELRAKGAPIDQELKIGYSKCIQFWTHDPDGNSFEFMELPPGCKQLEAIARVYGENQA
jgi:lactoylglutathione lyase